MPDARATPANRGFSAGGRPYAAFCLDALWRLSSAWGAEDQPIEAKLLSNSIENAQKQLEANNFERRKPLEYDDVMKPAAQDYNEQRRHVLDGVGYRADIVNDDKRLDRKRRAQSLSARTRRSGTLRAQEQILWLCAGRTTFISAKKSYGPAAEDITEVLRERAMKLYAPEELFGDNMREIERVILSETSIGGRSTLTRWTT